MNKKPTQHFLYQRKGKIIGRADMHIYDAVTQHLLYEGKGIGRGCFFNFLLAGFYFLLFILTWVIGGELDPDRPNYIKLIFSDIHGKPVFSFNRGSFGWAIKVRNADNKLIGKLYKKKLLDEKGKKLLTAEIDKKEKEVIVLKNEAEEIVAIKRSVLGFSKLKPSNNIVPKEKYDGEVIFYDENLTEKTKLTLLASICI